MAAMTTIFERLSKGRPAPVDEKTKQPDHAQKLLDWLQTWNQPTIGAAEILMYGPRPTRNQKNANNATEILVRHGWLIPKKRIKATGVNGESSANPSFIPQ